MMRKNKNKENVDINSSTKLSDFKKLLQENFKKLDKRMQAVEDGLKENHQEFLSMQKDVETKLKLPSILHSQAPSFRPKMLRK